MLKKRTGRGVRDLRSNKGNIYVNGVVAIFSDSDEILYYEKWNRSQFLQNLLSEGPSYIEKIMDVNIAQTTVGLPEEKLITDFIHNAKQYGYPEVIHREYSLIRTIKTDPNMDENTKEFVKSFSYISGKHMDMLHMAADGSFDIIEAKVRLNWTAIGQAIGYKHVFCKLQSIPISKVRSAIVCRQSDGFLEDVCDSLGVKVIILS
jgi:hypothetical protein